MAALTGRPTQLSGAAVATTGFDASNWLLEPGVRFKRLIIQNLDAMSAMELSFDGAVWFVIDAGETFAEWLDANSFYLRGVGITTPSYSIIAVGH